jgi:hypothetical protein
MNSFGLQTHDVPPLGNKKASSDDRKRQQEQLSAYLPHLSPPEGRAGFSTLRSAGFGRTGCYGVIGPDPSAVLDKFKRLLSSPLEKYREATGSLHLDDIYHNVVQEYV